MEFVAEHASKFDHTAHNVTGVGALIQMFRLFHEDGRGAAGHAGVEDFQAALQAAQHLSLADDRFDDHGIVGVETDEIEAAESGGVLVLFSNAVPAPVYFHCAALMGKISRGNISLLVGVQGMEKPYSERTRGSQAGAS